MVGEDIQQIRPIPGTNYFVTEDTPSDRDMSFTTVGQCFGCEQAKNYLYHYLYSTDPSMNTTVR